MSAQATFAGWCYLRDGAMVGPVPSNELVLALFRGQVDPDCRVYRVSHNGREYALLVADEQPVSTLRIDVRSLGTVDDRSLAPPDIRADESIRPPWNPKRRVG